MIRRLAVEAGSWSRRWSVAVVGSVALAASALALGIGAVQDRRVLLMPDLFETAVAVDAAAHGEQLVGAWSRLGLYHPGPAWFYWAAPFFSVSGGEPSALFLAALALVALGGPLIVAMVGGEDGPAAAAVAAVALLGAVHQLGLAGLAYPWNPTVVIVPVAVGIVAAATAWHRWRWWTAALAIVAGTFVAQAHLGALPLGATIVLACVAGTVRQRQRFARPLLVVCATVMVAAVPWIPVAVDQASGAGNLGATVGYAVTGEVDPRFAPEPPSRTLTLSPGEVGTHLAAMASLADTATASWGGADFIAGLEHRPSSRSVPVLVGLVLLAVVGAWPRREGSARRGFLVILSRLSLLALVIQVMAAARSRHEFRYYLIAGSAGVGMVLWLVAGLVVLDVVRTRVPASRGRIVAAGAGGVVAVLALVSTGPFHRFPGIPASLDADDPTIEQIRDLHAHPGVGLFVDRPERLNGQLRLVLALERSGVRVAVAGRYESRFGDRQRRAPWGREVAWSGPREDPPADCRPLGPFAGGVVCLMPEDG